MGRDYPQQPLVGVGVVVWRDDRVLLIQRGKPPRAGEWSLPGGKQELGETVAEAGRREVREETGLEVAVSDVVAVVDLIDRDEAGAVRFHYTLIDLLAEWLAGEATAGDDAAAIAWARLDELAAYTLWSETEQVIHRAAKRREEHGHADPTA